MVFHFKTGFARNVPMERYDHPKLLRYPSNVPAEHLQQFDFGE
jgi:hypothetical protein